MKHSFWAERWHGGQIGFHLEEVNSNLPRYWSDLGLGAGCVLVPLCGKSHDLDWLAEQGHRVRGVEFVDAAVAAFFDERGLVPAVERRSGTPIYHATPIELAVGDFFAIDPSVFEPCDAVYDRAALVAIAPDERRRYVEKLHRLTAPGARLMLVNFVHDVGSGPPFSIPDTELLPLCEGLFRIEKRAERDVLQAEPRFRERGATFMLEQVWLGTRVD